MQPVQVACAACGATQFRNPEKPHEAAIVHCGACGCELGTIAEIQSAGKLARAKLGADPDTEQLRTALRDAFSKLKTIKIE
jgi:hypothetical protein